MHALPRSASDSQLYSSSTRPPPLPSHARSEPLLIPKKSTDDQTYSALKTLQEISEKISDGYTFFMDSEPLKFIRDFIVIYAPEMAKGVLYLQKPVSYLKACDLAGPIAYGFKLNKYRKELQKTSGKSLTQTALKILYTFGKLTEHSVKWAVSSESLGWTAKLADHRFKYTATVLKTITVWSRSLGILSWALTIPKLLVSTIKIKKGVDFDFARWSNSVKSANPVEKLNAIKLSLSKFDKEDPLAIRSRIRVRKFIRIQDKKFDTWLSNLNFKSSTVTGQQKEIKRLMTSINGRIKQTTNDRKIEFLADSTNLVASAILFMGVLPPLGFILVGAAGLFSTAMIISQKMAQFRFEHKLGMATPPTSFKKMLPLQKVKYVARWTIGL